MWLSEELASWWYNLANCVLIVAAVLVVAGTGLAVWMGNVKEAYSAAERKEKDRQIAKIKMWLSEELASRWYNLANCVLIVAAVLAVAGTSLAVWMGNVKEAYSAAERKEKDRQIAKIKRDSASQIAAAKLQLTAKQTELEKEEQKIVLARATDKKAQLVLDQSLAARIFQREAKWELLEPLKARPTAKAVVICKKDDGEAWSFATTIVQALKGMHWEVDGPIETSERPRGGAPLVGAFVICRTLPDPMKIVEQAFGPLADRSTVELLLGAIGGNSIMVDPNLPEDSFKIVIGQRVVNFYQQ